MLKEVALTAAELIAKNIYRRTHGLISSKRVSFQSNLLAPTFVSRESLHDRLAEIGVNSDALVMAHTSVSAWRFLAAQDGKTESASSMLHAAKGLLSLFDELLGPSGSLAMPTNAAYQADDANLSFDRRKESIVTYDPLRTPSAVGLANELFRRSPGVKRSLHPYNSLACKGPLADAVLKDNLNDRKPLPHGIDSAYRNFTLRKGLIVSVGVSLRKTLTVLHVAEEVRDADWPIKNFFETRKYNIVFPDGPRIVETRQTRAEFMKYCFCPRKCLRDMVREGIVHEGSCEGIPVDWARADEVFDFMMRKNASGTYPYYLPRLLA